MQGKLHNFYNQLILGFLSRWKAISIFTLVLFLVVLPGSGWGQLNTKEAALERSSTSLSAQSHDRSANLTRKGISESDSWKDLSKNEQFGNQDGSIELLDKRDRFSKTFANPNGSFSKVQSSEPMHYKDEYGNWVKYDAKLVADNNRENVFKLEGTDLDISLDISTGQTQMNFTQLSGLSFGKNSVIWIINENGDVELYETITSKNHKRFEKADKKVVIKDFFNEIDRVQNFGPNKIKTDYIINERPVFNGNAKHMVFEDEYILPKGFKIIKDLEYGKETDLGWEGDLLILDGKNNEIARMYMPVYFDASVDLDSFSIASEASSVEEVIDNNYKENQNNTVSGAYELTLQSEGVYKIRLVVPVSWLKDENTIYPIVVDPTISYTYSFGVIPSCRYGSVNNVTKNIAIPAGATVTNTASQWQYTAQNGIWRSSIYTRIAGNNASYQWYQCSVSGGGLCNINPVDAGNIANGVYPTGIVPITIGITRVWGGGGCNSTYAFISNNSWITTLTYIAPPANDNCTNAQSITVQCPASATVVSGTTAYATEEAIADPSCDPGTIRDVWYTFNSGPNTSVDLTLTLGTASWIGGEVHTTCGNPAGFCDFNLSSPSPTVISGLVPNTTYRLRLFTNVDYDIAGSFTFTLTNSVNNPGEVSVPASICAGTATSITNVTAATGGPNNVNYYFYYRGGPSNVGWQMYDGPTTNTSSSLPAAVINTPGTWFIARNSDFGCGQANNGTTLNLQLIVNTPPTAPTAVSSSLGNTICSGQTTTLSFSGGSDGSGASYQWYAGGCGNGSVLGTGATLSVSPTSTTTYYVRRVGTSPCNGTTTACASVTVTVNTAPSAPTTLSSSLGNTICNGQTTTLSFSGGSDGSGASYQWYAGGCGNGSVLGTGATLSVSPTSTTTYYVRRVGTSPCNGTTTACASVTVNVTPTATAGTVSAGTTPQCEGSSTTYTVSGVELGGGTGAWSSDNTSVATVNSSTGVVTAVGAGTCNIVYTVTGGCGGTKTASASYTVDANPFASDAGEDKLACINSSATMTAANPPIGNGTWTWSPSSPSYVGGTSASDNNAQVMFSSVGSYTGTWTVTNGVCSSTTQDAIVDVRSGANNASLFSSAGAIETAFAFETCDEGGWTYYAKPQSQNEFLFAIKQNGNTFHPTNDYVTIVDLPGTQTIESLGGSPAIRGTWLIGRYWNVEFTGTLTNPVDVRFFVDPAEVTQAENEATAFLNNTAAATNMTSLTFFKTVSTAFDPATSLVNGEFTFTPAYLPYTTGTLNGVAYYELTGLTSFSGGTGGFTVNDNNASLLPVELLSFDVNAVDNQFIRLDWATASEINNEGFEVLRSTDGVNFERIAWIDGNGNSTEINEYVFNDRGVDKGITYYYQLKQIDYDGQYEYFDIKSARLDGKTTFTVGALVPNPSKGSEIVSVDIQTVSGEVLTVEIYDRIGAKVKSTSYVLFAAENALDINISDLAAGTYFLKFDSSKGSETKKLVVVK